MKPHKLSISGLQSFRSCQEIDFDRLSDCGMFGIFGPTGSGKSTILDALTLALYGRVGRARSGKQGIINEDETSASVSFSFSIGAGTERKTYRADRKYRTKDHISVASTLSRLVELNAAGEIVLADQENAVTAKVEEILGITLDDFVRAVVLPQGKFADFLTLRGVDRRKMLERLFSLERYGEKLAGRVKNRKEAASARLGALQGELQGMGDASSGAVAEAEARLQAAQTAAAQADNLLTEATQEHAAAAKIVSLQRDLALKEQALTAHAAGSGEIEQKAKRLEKAQQAAHIKPWLEQAGEARKNLEKAAQEETRAREACQTATSGAEVKKQLAGQARETRLLEEPGLTDRKARAENALAIEAQLSADEQKRSGAARRLQEIEARRLSAESELQKKKETIEALDQNLVITKKELEACQVSSEHRNALHEAGALIQDWENCRRQVEAAKAENARRTEDFRKAADSLQNCVDQERAATAERTGVEQELAGMSEACPADEATLTAEIAFLDRMELQLRNLSQQQADIRLAADRIHSLNRQLDQAEQEDGRAQEAARAAEADYELAQRRYSEAMQNDRRKMAALLAEGLKAGLPCPVCGALDHPRPACLETAADADDLTQQLKSALEIKQSAWRGAAALTASSREKISALTAQAKAEAENLKPRYDQALALQGEIAAELALPPETADTAACRLALTEQRQQNDSRRKKLEQWRIKQAELHSRLENLREQGAALAANLAATRQKNQTALLERDKAAMQLQAAGGQFETAAERMAGAARSLGAATGLIAGDQAGFIRNMAADIKKRDSLKEKLEQKLVSQEAERKKLEAERDRQQQELQQAELDCVSQTTLLAGMDAGIKEVRARWNALTGGASATRLLQEASDAIALLNSREKSAQAEWEAADRERQAADAALAAGKAALTQAGENHKLAETQLRREIVSTGFTDETAVRQALLPDNLIAAEEGVIRKFREKLMQLQTEKSLVETELANRSVTEEKWRELQQLLADADADRKEKNRAMIEAAQTCRELAAKHQRWQELDAEFSSLRLHLDNLDKIFGLIRGNMLVEYLAQEQMNIVLVNASERLKQLTHGRYALEIDSEGSFIVRDDANGGSRRPAGSLSGGETFQTSLALALALSDQIQLRGKYSLEFFFLDEGFGSLDRMALDVSMTTLERLRHDRLTIGIISHVEELQQRMPRRLMVTPPDLLGNGSRVKIEIA